MAYGNAYGGGYGDMNQAGGRQDPKDAIPEGWQSYWTNQMNPDAQREQFERGMMQGEQQRRMYDSETARMQGTQKFGVLGGLIGKVGSGGGGGYAGFMPSAMSHGYRVSGDGSMVGW